MWKPATKVAREISETAKITKGILGLRMGRKMKVKKPVAVASSNWAALQKTLPKSTPNAAQEAPSLIVRGARVKVIPPKSPSGGERGQSVSASASGSGSGSPNVSRSMGWGEARDAGAKDKGKGKADVASSRGSSGSGGWGQGIGRFLGRASNSASAVAGPSTVNLAAAPGGGPTADPLGVRLLPLPSGESALLVELREMIAGRAVLTPQMKAPGNYVAIDCEMIGLGPMGAESALARVSLVNFHGHILLDTFVRASETVTDWRTWVSGVRPADLKGAPSFAEVQKQVAEILEGRILVGHAIQHDLRILLLSHPGPLVRDTQKCPVPRDGITSKIPALKKLALVELGVEIQTKAHSSVTDARATMALYRLHKTAWEKTLHKTMDGYRKTLRAAPSAEGATKAGGVSAVKRKRAGSDMGDAGAGAPNGEEQNGSPISATLPGKGVAGVPSVAKRSSAKEVKGGKKGVSAGIGMVIHRKNGEIKGGTPKRAKVATLLASGGGGGKWWEQSAA